MTRVLVATISFGHDSNDIEAALRSSVELSGTDDKIRIVCIDDSSGRPPNTVEGIESAVTSHRLGFAGAVNELVERFGHDRDRLILVNPDAKLGKDGIRKLIQIHEPVGIPTITGPSGEIENLRHVTTPAAQLKALMLGERSVKVETLRTREQDFTLQMPPYCPSGAVISIDIALLRAVPLRPVFFWLELSDWTRRLSNGDGAAVLRVISNKAEHVGASTSVRYPLSVAASQVRAKSAYVREYGSLLHRTALPLGVLLRAIRFGIKQRSFASGLFIAQVALGQKDWRVER